MYFEFDFELYDIIFTFGLLSLFSYFFSLNKHCACGVKIPEGGGMCECGEYNSRMIIRREDELKRMKEEKRKGNDYDTIL